MRGTSQRCPCGAKVPKKLSDREHVCTKCGLITTRDHASATEILRLGLSLHTLTKSEVGTCCGCEQRCKSDVLRSVNGTASKCKTFLATTTEECCPARGTLAGHFTRRLSPSPMPGQRIQQQRAYLPLKRSSPRPQFYRQRSWLCCPRRTYPWTSQEGGDARRPTCSRVQSRPYEDAMLRPL